MALTHFPDAAWKIAESSQWAVMLNKEQDLIGRIFLLLKREETDVAALSPQELMELWSVVRQVKKVLGLTFGPDHYNFAFLMNIDAQVHFHVIPRYKDKREFAGGTFTDPNFGKHYGTGPTKKLDDTFYAELISVLRQKFTEATAK
jgi:diadenosine tetraphosphate (Ap4A) HIT family hydrolase